jgi:hypothetical protein
MFLNELITIKWVWGIIMRLFKKSKEQNELPPLPEDLPPMDEVMSQNRDTHDQIPNDIEIGKYDNESSHPQDFSPDNLPDLDEQPDFNMVDKSDISLSQNSNNGPSFDNNDNNKDNNNVQQTKKESSSDNLPELPDLPDTTEKDMQLPDIPDMEESNQDIDLNDINISDNNKVDQDKNKEFIEDKETSNPDKQNKIDIELDKEEVNEPRPDIDDDVPKPPAIFSEGSMYETPDEIKDIVNNRNTSSSYYNDQYSSNSSSEAPGTSSVMDKPSIHNRQGPIFVDIDSFKTILGNIETIKNDIKSSDVVFKHLEDIKNSKDKELELWRKQLENLQNKISYIDRVLFED